MATWQTCSAQIAPPAPLLPQPWRGGTPSPWQPPSPLQDPASLAPSPVPWSRPHKPPQGWWSLQVPPFPLFKGPGSYWWSMMPTQIGKPESVGASAWRQERRWGLSQSWGGGGAVGERGKLRGLVVSETGPREGNYMYHVATACQTPWHLLCALHWQVPIPCL